MNCDAIAPHYAWIERAAFGGLLERCRLEFLGDLADARRALVLGGGDGRFLTRLLAAHPSLHVDYVDFSAGMLRLAQRRAGNSRVTYHCVNALDGVLPGCGYDLVITHFFLDCFCAEELKRVIARVRGAAAPGARWLVSEFRVPCGRLAGLGARGLIRFMYAFFRVTTGLRTKCLTDHHGLFERAGFVLRDRRDRAAGLLSSEVWIGPVE